MAAMDDPIASEQFRAVADLAGLSSGFEALFQAAPSPFLVVIPPDYAIIAVNDAYLRATMTERAAILGRVLFEVFPDNPDDPSADGTRKLRASLERVIATRRLDQMSITRYPIPRPAPLGGGFDERWWTPRNAPVFGPGGEVACIIHHVEDVTDRVRAEAARRESEEKYRVLFDSIDEAFCTIEVAFDENERAVDYRFLLVNPSFARQTGIANAAGRWMREIAPRHEQHWFETYGRVALTGEPVRFINGIVTGPSTITFATALPETVPNSDELTTATLPGPPGWLPVIDNAKSMNSWPVPLRSMNAPNRTKSIT